MGRNPPQPDTSENPEPPRDGEVVCFGFLTYCLLLVVDQLPPRNGGAAVCQWRRRYRNALTAVSRWRCRSRPEEWR